MLARKGLGTRWAKYQEGIRYRTEPDAEPNRTEPNRTEPRRIRKAKAEPRRTGKMKLPNRTEPNRLIFENYGTERNRTEPVPSCLRRPTRQLCSQAARQDGRQVSLALKRGTAKGDSTMKSLKSHVQVTFKWLKGDLNMIFKWYYGGIPFCGSPFQGQWRYAWSKPGGHPSTRPESIDDRQRAVQASKPALTSRIELLWLLCVLATYRALISSVGKVLVSLVPNRCGQRQRNERPAEYQCQMGSQGRGLNIGQHEGLNRKGIESKTQSNRLLLTTPIPYDIALRPPFLGTPLELAKMSRMAISTLNLRTVTDYNFDVETLNANDVL